MEPLTKGWHLSRPDGGSAGLLPLGIRGNTGADGLPQESGGTDRAVSAVPLDATGSPLESF